MANLEISLFPMGSSLIWNTIEVNGDEKLLSQMFCDDKDSQENAKQIKNQWDKLSSTDKVSVENIHYIYNISKVTFEVNIFSNRFVGTETKYQLVFEG